MPGFAHDRLNTSAVYSTQWILKPLDFENSENCYEFSLRHTTQCSAAGNGTGNNLTHVITMIRRLKISFRGKGGAGACSSFV